MKPVALREHNLRHGPAVVEGVQVGEGAAINLLPVSFLKR